MKRALCIGALALAGLFFPLTAQAGHGSGWGFNFGFGIDGGFFRAGFSHGFSSVGACGTICAPRPVHVHCPVPCYTSVWVPPVYSTVVVGYDRCGRPICRSVEVRCGHYETRLAGHRCSSCGSYCN